MKILFIIFLFLSCLSFAQFKDKESADLYIRGSVCIPNPLSSQMFSTAFDGIYEANLSVGAKVTSNFYLGIGYQNFLFQNDKDFKYTFYKASIPYNTKLGGNGFFVRGEYCRFFSTIGFMSYALQTGIMVSEYKNVNEDTNKVNQPFGLIKFSAPFVQPEVSANFIIEKHLSFSVVLSYTTLFSHFDPKAPRFNQFESISNSSNNYFMSWINFGFGFNVLLNRK